VYGELRRVAARQMHRERRDHSLQPTALVHEAYMRLVDQRQVNWQDRAHFFGVAARQMRRILIDHARKRDAQKRNAGLTMISLAEVGEIASPGELPVLLLDDALNRLEEIDPALTHVVELRVFAGLTIDEAAHVLAVSPSTVKREWQTAKAWLARELGRDTR
jgi:RNA polymerase sigma-70 factor (ECF subfamily)